MQGNRKWIMIAGGVVSFGAAVAIIALVVGNLSGVSRADFRRVDDQIGVVHASYMDASNIELCQGRSTTISAFNECVDNALAAFTEMETEFQRLGEERAILEDSELREKFEQIESELERFRQVFNLGADYLRVLAPIIFANTNYTSVEVMVSGFRELAILVRAVEVSNDSVVELRDNIAKSLEDIANASESEDSEALQAVLAEYTRLLEDLERKFSSLDDYTFANMMSELSDMVDDRIN